MTTTTREALKQALEEITEVAMRVDGWESFPSGPIEKAQAALAAANAAPTGNPLLDLENSPFVCEECNKLKHADAMSNKSDGDRLTCINCACSEGVSELAAANADQKLEPEAQKTDAKNYGIASEAAPLLDSAKGPVISKQAKEALAAANAAEAKPAQEPVAPAILINALQKISRWHGEFPSTGKTWEFSGNPMPYEACYGSNGERDYMRQVALDALASFAALPAPVDAQCDRDNVIEMCAKVLEDGSFLHEHSPPAILARQAAAAIRRQKGAANANKQDVSLINEGDMRPDMAEAYTGAREDLAIWKKRALEAEESCRRLTAVLNEENGPTHMGEPALPPVAQPASGAVDELEAFEQWAKREGGMSLQGAYEYKCEDGRFPATYCYANTETAWRAWANKSLAALSAVNQVNAAQPDDLSSAIERGTNAWSGTPAGWVDDLRGGEPAEKDAARWREYVRQQYEERARRSTASQRLEVPFDAYKASEDSYIDAAIAAQPAKSEQMG